MWQRREVLAPRPLSFWEERMAQGALGEQGVTYLALVDGVFHDELLMACNLKDAMITPT